MEDYSIHHWKQVIGRSNNEQETQETTAEAFNRKLASPKYYNQEGFLHFVINGKIIK